MTAIIDGTNGLLQQYDYQTPTTGFSYTFAAGTTTLIMNPAGTLATGTITMPASPSDGMTITFSSTKQITALTLSGSAGQTVVSAVTVLPANQATSYTYRLSNASWYPVSTVATLTLDSGTIVGAGTTTTAPLLFTTGTNLTTATAGAVEYASPIFTATPIGTQRGIVSAAQYYRLNAAYAGTNATGAQSAFGVGVTLSASTVYEFEIIALFSKTAGATSHTFSFLFGGTATLNNIGYFVFNNVSTVSPTAAGISAQGTYGFVQVATSTVLATAIANATTHQMTQIKGTVSVNAGGTFIPQYALSAAPGGAYSTAIGSYIKIYPIGAAGAATNVGTWA